MRTAYDFSKGRRGKHVAKYAAGTNVVVIEPWRLGGGSRIRTHEGVTPLTAFKTAAFNHSAIPPRS
jgi:hypothetical protein